LSELPSGFNAIFIGYVAKARCYVVYSFRWLKPNGNRQLKS